MPLKPGKKIILLLLTISLAGSDAVILFIIFSNKDTCYFVLLFLSESIRASNAF